MRTTLEIPDALLDEARRRAEAEGTTVEAILELALRQALTAAPRPHPHREMPDAVFRGGQGVQPGIDLSNWEQIRAICYEGHGG
jgi:hypothetical protein